MSLIARSIPFLAASPHEAPSPVRIKMLPNFILSKDIKEKEKVQKIPLKLAKKL